MLVADQPGSVAVVREVLGSRAIVWGVADLSGALAAVERGVDLILCGVYFDDSRMFDLLDRARAHAKSRTVPFVCFHSGETELPRQSAEALRVACHAVGPVPFIDVCDLARTRGPAAANEELREAILRNLPPELQADPTPEGSQAIRAG